MRCLLLLIAVCSCVLSVYAQKYTTVDDDGNTVVETRSKDKWGDTYTLTLTTLTSTSTSTSTTKSRTSRSSSSSTSTSSTDTPAITAVTASIPAGRIASFNDYQSSVSNDLASLSTSAYAAFFATATDWGIKSSGTRGTDQSKIVLVICTMVSLGIAYGLGIILAS